MTIASPASSWFKNKARIAFQRNRNLQSFLHLRQVYQTSASQTKEKRNQEGSGIPADVNKWSIAAGEHTRENSYGGRCSCARRVGESVDEVQLNRKANIFEIKRERFDSVPGFLTYYTVINAVMKKFISLNIIGCLGEVMLTESKNPSADDRHDPV